MNRPPLGMEFYEFANGRAVVHAKGACAGEHCCIHNPSMHAMIEEPMLLRETGLVERLCQHGVGHPDPDSAAYFRARTGQNSWGVHGCCQSRCCSKLDRHGG